MPHKYKHFLSFTSISSIFGAITTAFLFLWASAAPPDFESQLKLADNPWYMGKLWILFFHPQFNFLAVIGIAIIRLRETPGLVISSVLFLLIWMITEMSQQAFLIDALNQMWRPAYVQADTELKRNIYETLIRGASGFSDSKYFVLLYAFGLGSLLLGLSLLRDTGLAKWIGSIQMFIGILSLSSFVRYYFYFSSLDPIVNWLYEWIYVFIQPFVRLLIAYWLFSQIKKLNYKDESAHDYQA
ncbi:hypothetical protein F9K33_01795 [bacterium]|nr:MAG: hypothetical protein F9K33_01795 [bacterium]